MLTKNNLNIEERSINGRLLNYVRLDTLYTIPNCRVLNMAK